MQSEPEQKRSLVSVEASLDVDLPTESTKLQNKAKKAKKGKRILPSEDEPADGPPPSSEILEVPKSK